MIKTGIVIPNRISRLSLQLSFLKTNVITTASFSKKMNYTRNVQFYEHFI